MAVPAVAFASLVLLVAIGPTAHAQAPTDSIARADSARARRLGAVRVTATRAADTLATVPWSVGVAGVRELRRGQPTIGLDEALGGIPGVYVANRYNYAVDQRVAVRGFGARANFGLRSITVLLDGVPQTLPDGQSQLTNVELGAVSRVEVLRGASSALWGNGSGGVIAFETDMSAPARLQQALRVEGGAYGLRKAQLRTAGRTDRAVGTLSLSRLTTDGFRQYSAAELRVLNAGVDYTVADAWSASLRAHAASMPEAQNPGALTFAEWRANPDSASAFNVARGAGKTVDQQQLSLALRRDGGAGGTSIGVTTWGIRRDLENPIAAPPPGGPNLPSNGTLVTIDRGVGGLRVDAERPLGVGGRAPRVAVGGDVQRMRDHRRNQRATGGRATMPTDTLLVDQVETVTSVGAFARVGWMPAPRVRLEGGGRHDRIRFAVDDRFRREGATVCTELTCQELDDSGARTLDAWSGHLGASVAVATWLVPYANLSTAFETPTTTELQTGRDALGGFTEALGPQRTRGAELGARGDAGRLQYAATLFTMEVRDAIVQTSESGGRAFFANAARTRTTGAELQTRVRAHEALGVEAAYTWTRAVFADYQIVRAGQTLTFTDERRLPGVPPRMLRVGLRAGPVRGLSLDVDHTSVSDLYADDFNEQRVRGWGRGLLNARAAWSGRAGAVPIEPFVGVLNLLDERYVAAVTVNGANGRVLEPGTPRAVYAGVEIGWRTSR